ncbi:MAG TPA: hypothetical protein VJR25_02565 [Microbacterium sp.]|uniref:hypothetical protein n=1 Tax=Microbacterium sp. TaxID=51671 RepID=UPI002B466758|nr:hypothetical protein [Microbacterium sp.]HKT55631.1 hypothetical protein [Microbacterium sp.]
MSIMDPPWRTGVNGAAAASGPEGDAIARAVTRLSDAGARDTREIAGSPAVVHAVRWAFEMAEDLNTDPLGRAFQSYFLETVAGLAITRVASGMEPLTEEQVAEVRNSLCEKLRVFVESP